VFRVSQLSKEETQIIGMTQGLDKSQEESTFITGSQKWKVLDIDLSGSLIAGTREEAVATCSSNEDFLSLLIGQRRINEKAPHSPISSPKRLDGVRRPSPQYLTAH
jgi:hypothetical protein